MTTAFFAHAADDGEFARALAQFLEPACDVTCDVDGGLIGPGQDLIAKAEEGLSADVLVLLLSPSSSPRPWVRQRWEPVLFEQAVEGNVEVVTVLVGESPFPALLRRRNFFDVTGGRLKAWRLLKRWFMLRERSPGNPPGAQVSGDLEALYAALADRAGALHAGGAEASRFAAEAEDEFEAVLWVPCHGRSRAQAAGELAYQLGLALDGQAKENCRRIRELLIERRCLVVLDAPSPEIARELTPGGRTSTLITRDAVKIAQTPETLAFALELVAARRFAEAYELLYRLLDDVIEPDNCARELTWICEFWDRPNEANVLRVKYRPAGVEQLVLF